MDHLSAVIQTKPEVKLGKYKGIEIKKIEYNVSDDDVEHELGHMLERNARVVTVEDRPVENGDITVIDFEGSVDGVKFEGGKGEGHELEIGSNTFIPGFEEQIIGMKMEEERSKMKKWQFKKSNLRERSCSFYLVLERFKPCKNKCCPI